MFTHDPSMHTQRRQGPAVSPNKHTTMNSSASNKPCFRFRDKGKCSFGERCRYSHELDRPSTIPQGSPSTSSRQPGLDRQRVDSLREWKRLLRYANHFPDRVVCGRFFEQAVKLIDGDLGACQEAVKLLAGDDGLAYIRVLIETHIPSATGAHGKQDIWAKQIQPLFTVLTHPRVADSGGLEQEVATIYNFMQGIGSRRMRSMFDFTIELADFANSNAAQVLVISPPNTLVIIEASLAVLSKMVDCNTNNIIDEAFKDVLERFDSIIQRLDETADQYLMLRSQRWISYISRRLGVGEKLPSSRVQSTQNIGSRAEFTLPKDLPGYLAASGPRHDNDHADISNISVLPTYDEVVSVYGEYLPSNDPSSFHLPGIVGRLDREFRLLREDTVGQLRDAVRGQLELMRGQGKKENQPRQNLFTHTYDNAKFIGTLFKRPNGLDLTISFPQPRKLNYEKRRDWWSQSKRLQPGALVCVVGSDSSILFCVVAETTHITADQRPRRNQDEDDTETSKHEDSLAEDDAFAYVHLNIAEPSSQNIKQALGWYKNVGRMRQIFLVEFPGVLLASFQHTLKALQCMSKAPDVPFVDMIAPPTQTAGLLHIPPPLYTTKADFYFDLDCLSNDGTKLELSTTQRLDPQTLMNHSTLDETQASALINCLSRSLALIQGPPGTGKSYTGEKIIKVLLANKAKGHIGPILCVCYTNHALDQLLEHLLDDGVKQIIRIGSRSKSDRLEDLNLRSVAMSADRTKEEKRTLWTATQSLGDHERIAKDSLRQLEYCLGQPALQTYLDNNHHSHHDALFGKLVDDDGFQQVNRRPHQRFSQWLSTGEDWETRASRSIQQLLTAELWTMTRTERSSLYHYWQKCIRDPIICDFVQEHEDYMTIKSQRDRVSQEVDLRCLSAADVVGVTTTGLARNIDLLRRLRCKVLICEEAGEVLEAHNLTALLPSIEHCILIGDQQQLQPQINNYDLSSANPRGVQYSLDVSLFERLVSPSGSSSQRLPYDTLETQRRMHPTISELIRAPLYPALVDGGTVAQYPEVAGMKHRLFWLHHTVQEDQSQQQGPTSTSRTNSFEVGMTVALVQHLVRQNTYAPDDIAVITPYLGQLHRLRRAMQNMVEISFGEEDLEELEALSASKVDQQEISAFTASKSAARTTLLKSIRLATVDNFQGEEAKVVVISLVRSNNERRCGFLRTTNRINVLLSRAKHGMYIIGNANTCEDIPMWKQVIGLLKDRGNIGEALQLQCPRHLNIPISVSTPDHFLQFSPEGGCSQHCDKRLSCGHACINRCHSEVLHGAVKCLEPCPRFKTGCTHACKRHCGDPCEPKCTEVLCNPKVILSCGHKVSAALCWQVQEPSSIVCHTQVTKTIPGCNHTVNIACCTDVTAADYRCTSLCGDPQTCGHSCRSECYRCKDRKDGKVVAEHHQICQQVCNRAYTACRHGCRKACHGKGKCPPCSHPCEVRCSHSRCSKKCYEPCAPCAEQTCSSVCPHQKCTMPCAAPCDWVPCSRRCEKLISCGHQCPSICGEACPDAKYCQVCGIDDIKSAIVDFIMGSEYQEVNLDEDPCIFPDCGHFLTKTNMDGLMDLKEHYEMSADLDSTPIALSNSSKPFSMDEIKTCPTCRGSLRNIARYGKIIRRAMLDETTKKFITWSHGEFLGLANRLIDVQARLAGFKGRPQQQKEHPRKLVGYKGRLLQLHLMNDWVGDKRYEDAIRLSTQISTFIRTVRKEEQPLQRVANFVQHATRQRNTTGSFVLDESAIQIKGELQALALSLKCEIMIFTDFMTIRRDLMEHRPDINLNMRQEMIDCESLIERARSSHYPREQVEGHIYLAKFCAFARTFAPEPTEEPTSNTPPSIGEELKQKGETHIAAARELLIRYPSTAPLASELEEAEKWLHGGTFYTEVSAEEMRAVYAAMAGEFSGTGHWYYCANGHPFTIGECGMPMQEARCPECGSPVGGTSHQPVAGVRHANDIDALAGDVSRMRV